jgi:hypothetical protein
MKIGKTLLPLMLIALIISACSKDEDAKPKNGFTLDGKFYETSYASWYENEVLGSELSLINTATQPCNCKINFIGIYGIHDIDGNYVNTYTYSETELIDGTFETGEYIAGRTFEQYQSDPEVLVTGGTVTIKSFNASSIEIEYEITFDNGKTAKGSYKGNYELD